MKKLKIKKRTELKNLMENLSLSQIEKSIMFEDDILPAALVGMLEKRLKMTDRIANAKELNIINL